MTAIVDERSRLVEALIQNGFGACAHAVCGLYVGMCNQHPYKKIVVERYIKQMRREEETYNQRQQSAIRAAARQFDTEVYRGPVEHYTEAKQRFLLQEEAKLLDEELVKRFGYLYFGPVAPQSTDRWLERILNGAKIPDPGKREEEKQKILQCQQDYEIIRNNMSVGTEEAGSRTVFGTFAAHVLEELAKTASDIKAKKNCSDMTKQEKRALLLFNEFASGYALLQKIVDNMKAGGDTSPTVQLTLPQVQLEKFKEYKKKFTIVAQEYPITKTTGIARLQQIIAPRKLSSSSEAIRPESPQRERNILVEDITPREAALRECFLSGQQFVTRVTEFTKLLEEHCQDDFGEQEKGLAETLQETPQYVPTEEENRYFQQAEEYLMNKRYLEVFNLTKEIFSRIFL